MKIPFIGKSNRIQVILLLTLGISGCASFVKLQAWSEPYSLPEGSTLSVNQDLTVNPNSVSAWIQFGKVINRKEVDLDSPNCRFELYTIKPVAQSILKDANVAIIRFVNSNEYVSKGNVMYASLAAEADDDGGPMAQIFRTEVYLKSSAQPDLFRLTCEVWEDLFNGVYLTVDQIQQTLGDIATFHPKK
jgi:hypothetical protein